MIDTPSTKQWRNLTNAQKVGMIVVGTIQLSLLAAALIDLRRRTPDEINGSKRMWTAAAFINFVGPLSYFIWGRKR